MKRQDAWRMGPPQGAVVRGDGTPERAVAGHDWRFSEAPVGWLFTILVVVASAVWLLRRFAFSGGGSGPDLGELPGLRSHAGKVTFEEGRIADVDGSVPRNVLHAFADIAGRNRLSGEVRILGRRDLRFTLSIPDGVQQQLRNAYFAASTVH